MPACCRATRGKEEKKRKEKKRKQKGNIHIPPSCNKKTKENLLYTNEQSPSSQYTSPVKSCSNVHDR